MSLMSSCHYLQLDCDLAHDCHCHSLAVHHAQMSTSDSDYFPRGQSLETFPLKVRLASQCLI